MNIRYVIYCFCLLYHYCSFGAMSPVFLAFKQCTDTKIFNATMFSQLLNSGVDVNATNMDGDSLLFCAVASNNYECAKFLLAHGADVNKTDLDGHATPLHVACVKESEKMVRLLLAQKNIDPNIKSTVKEGETPLIISSKGPERVTKDIVIKRGNPPV